MALIQHWKLDDNAASTTIVATVGTNGTLGGGDNTADKTVSGPGGSITAGLSFNGTDDYIDISGAGLSFASGSDFSVSAWFRSVSGNAGIIGRSAHLVNNSMRSTSDTNIRVRLGADVDFTVPSLGTTWHHCLFVKDTSNNGRLFLDGTESSSGSQAMGTATMNSNRLGGNFSTTNFSVELAGVKIFDTDESANVAALYAEGTGGGVPIPVFRHHYRQQGIL